MFPSQLGDAWLKGLVLALVATVVARPLATIVVGMPFRFSLAEARRPRLGRPARRRVGRACDLPVIAGVGGAQSLFNIAFFAVLASTILQGTTFQALAERLGVTTSESALPVRLMEPATIRRLGAEVVEHRVGEGDAAAGRRVRELGLPRDALLNVIVRGDQAIPPRGSTTIQPGDRLHVLVRQEAAVEFRALLERWRDGPLDPPRRRRAVPRGPRCSARVRGRPADGDPSRPATVGGIDVVEQLRTRRDRPGAVVGLATAARGHRRERGRRLGTRAHRRRSPAACGRPPTRRSSHWWSEVVGALSVI